jgi:hypothetical protein
VRHRLTKKKVCVVKNQQDADMREAKGHSDGQGAKYVRFGAMILTSMVIMYGVTYLNTFQLDHVRWSEMRGFMTLLMGSTMAVVMLLFMLGMYKNWKINVGILAAAVVLFGRAGRTTCRASNGRTPRCDLGRHALRARGSPSG